MSKIVSLSEAGSIAIHAMVIIAKKNKMVNVTEISEETGSSKHHVAKVMQRLVKDKYLSSTRGPSGGFKLLIDPKEISLLDIYESIEGKIELSECIMENAICPFNKCIIDNIGKKLTSDFITYLKDQTLDLYI
jgi:Rrf2 family protein